MRMFSKDHVIFLPHTKQYRDVYNISLDELLLTLNEPDHKGFSDDRYTAEKTIGKKRISVYFYQTLPLQGKQNALYAIVDFVGFTNKTH